MGFPKSLHTVISHPRYRHFREVFWFGVITLAIHYGYRYWARDLVYWPVNGGMQVLQRELTDWVLQQSSWIDLHLLRLPVTTSGNLLLFDNGSWIAVNSSCAGDKQILQFALLLLIYPGPWRHKLWFIPAGMLSMHFTNVLRIVLLSVVSAWRPEWWHLAHDTVLRALFYVVILVLWIIWMERFNNREPGLPSNF